MIYPRHYCNAYEVWHSTAIDAVPRCSTCGRTWRFDAQVGWVVVKFGSVA